MNARPLALLALLLVLSLLLPACAGGGGTGADTSAPDTTEPPRVTVPENDPAARRFVERAYQLYIERAEYEQLKAQWEEALPETPDTLPEVYYFIKNSTMTREKVTKINGERVYALQSRISIPDWDASWYSCPLLEEELDVLLSGNDDLARETFAADYALYHSGRVYTIYDFYAMEQPDFDALGIPREKVIAMISGIYRLPGTAATYREELEHLYGLIGRATDGEDTPAAPEPTGVRALLHNEYRVMSEWNEDDPVANRYQKCVSVFEYVPELMHSLSEWRYNATVELRATVGEEGPRVESAGIPESLPLYYLFIRESFMNSDTLRAINSLSLARMYENGEKPSPLFSEQEIALLTSKDTDQIREYFTAEYALYHNGKVYTLYDFLEMEAGEYSRLWIPARKVQDMILKIESFRQRRLPKDDPRRESYLTALEHLRDLANSDSVFI